MLETINTVLTWIFIIAFLCPFLGLVLALWELLVCMFGLLYLKVTGKTEMPTTLGVFLEKLMSVHPRHWLK
jgi:hypothetical protein